jgi:hypothetical protein
MGVGVMVSVGVGESWRVGERVRDGKGVADSRGEVDINKGGGVVTLDETPAELPGVTSITEVQASRKKLNTSAGRKIIAVFT